MFHEVLSLEYKVMTRVMIPGPRVMTRHARLALIISERFHVLDEMNQESISRMGFSMKLNRVNGGDTMKYLMHGAKGRIPY